ncbi:GumC family protein [Pedobacter sp. AW31-3R]|uniref:GumC family protein n=1 Tax=Pedobacter sp. AW31-3R TaxID=3445781 RepID=UPI003F9FA9F8
MEQFIYTPFTETREEEKKDTRQVMNQYLFHWPVFIISLMVTMALAFVYIKHATPVYLVKAKLSIKDDKNKTATDKDAALQQLNISTSPKLAESEVEILRSRPIIKTIVEELQLWCTYSMRNGFRTADLYSSSPVKFKFLGDLADLKDFNFKITFMPAGRYLVTFEDDKEINASFSSTFESEFGKWQLIPTENLKKYAGKTISISLRNPEKTITAYQMNIGIFLNKTTPIVDLKIEDVEPKRGAKILNRLVAAYQRSNIIDKNKETQSTLKFIDERLDSLKMELTAVEKDVEGYKSSIGLTDISSKSQFLLNNVETNDKQLNEVNIQLNIINGLKRYLNSSNENETPPSTVGLEDPGLNNLATQLTKLQLERAKDLATTPESNPMFVSKNKQISSTKRAFSENIYSMESSLLATKRQLMSFNSKFESGIKDMPGQERQYVSIKRQQGIKESLYIYLLQKREEVALSYASTLTDARTVEEAYYGLPQSNKKMPLAIALVFGIAIPVVLISTRNTIRDKVMTKTDIEQVTSAPVICELIQESSKKPIVVLNKGAFAIGEQIRALRTSILRAYDRKGKVILFTSSIAKEGKSYVASNIGVSLAILGKKTVILELDLRKPQIAKNFNLPETVQPGLSDYLAGLASMEDILSPSGVHPNLYIMRAGRIPSNPSELLEGYKMEQLINALRIEFDNVLLDSPPLHLVTDAMILAPLCDMTMYMLRHNYTPKSELKFIDKIFRDHKLFNMHLVFNGVRMDSRFGYEINYGYYKDQEDTPAWHSLFGNFSSRLLLH